jgi:hypothetical protein
MYVIPSGLYCRFYLNIFINLTKFVGYKTQLILDKTFSPN